MHVNDRFLRAENIPTNANVPDSNKMFSKSNNIPPVNKQQTIFKIHKSDFRHRDHKFISKRHFPPSQHLSRIQIL